MVHEMVAVVLKNDILATQYLTETFPETEIYYIKERDLANPKKVFCDLLMFLNSIGEKGLTVTFGVGNLEVATYLMGYAKERNSYFYMLEPKGVVKIA